LEPLLHTASNDGFKIKGFMIERCRKKVGKNDKNQYLLLQRNPTS
jgi:hypothetical protein